MNENARRMILAVDFDGTVVHHAFPAIGEALPMAIPVLQALSQRCEIILWTCREGVYLDAAVAWCKESGIKLAGVNVSPPHLEFRPEGGRKVYADVYIDDRNLGGFPGWEAVARHFELMLVEAAQ